MPVHIRAQCRFPASTNLARDVVSINPCFRSTFDGPVFDPDSLAQSLANLLAAWQEPTSDPVEVRLYDLDGTKPVYPMAVKTANGANTADVTDEPQETAVCLSFFADHNEPRRRGRLYIPHFKIGNKSDLDHHVNSSAMARVGALAPMLSGLGGADIAWVVWSERDHAAHQVTNWFVDNAWDTVRSRGRGATERITGTVSG